MARRRRGVEMSSRARSRSSRRLVPRPRRAKSRSDVVANGSPSRVEKTAPADDCDDAQSSDQKEEIRPGKQAAFDELRWACCCPKRLSTITGCLALLVVFSGCAGWHRPLNAMPIGKRTKPDFDRTPSPNIRTVVNDTASPHLPCSPSPSSSCFSEICPRSCTSPTTGQTSHTRFFRPPLDSLYIPLQYAPRAL